MRARMLCLVAMLVGATHISTAQIHVNTPLQGVVSNTPQTSTLCSLQEAIYATEFGANIALDQTDPDDTYNTGCTDPSGLWYQIVLPGGELDFNTYWDGDGHNPFGPTATPIICGVVQIVGNGTSLVWKGAGHARLFAVGVVSISPTSGVLTTGTYCGIVAPNLTLQNVYVKGFQVKGGDATPAWGAGGGLGAGGAIYAGHLVDYPTPSLTVENSTFDSNAATGGNGGCGAYVGGGGGGGLGGNGGGISFISGGGGGGGSTGNGGTGLGIEQGAGGGGGGTVYPGTDASLGFTGPIGGAGGLYCGGNGGGEGDGGHNATCPGGGGGGGGSCESFICGPGTKNGGNGGYGGGGGGGGTGGSGGFGGGGGSGTADSNNGGNGGFGGGAGAGSSSPGAAGPFGGFAVKAPGGGGGGLGGAIFADDATVTIRNSTFYNNSVTGGLGGGPNTVIANGSTCAANGVTDQAGNGEGSGGAVFAVNGSLTVVDSTITGNSSTNGGGGISFYTHNFCTANVCLGGANYFTLDNTILAANGAAECRVMGQSDLISVTVAGAGNLITQNDSQYPCPGIVSMEDPQLSPLARNGGSTPTMAIPLTSPAFNTADAQTSLSADQRGVVRPQLGGYDIGAFELCRPEFYISPVGGIAVSVQLASYSTKSVTVSSTNCFFNQPVTLAANALPHGVLASFNPAQTTPPVGGSSYSTLQVSLGPAFMPQNFTLNVTGTASGDSGPLAHSFGLNTTPVVTAPSIISVINQDQTLGCLDMSGISQSLTAKLNASQTLITGGHLQGAVNVLMAFQLETQAQAGKHIAAGCTDSTGTQFSTPQTLIADAQFLQNTVGSVAPADPIVGSVVNASNVGIAGATVNLLNSSRTVVATTQTDAVGFYYFGDTSRLTSGANYTVNVSIPQGYKGSTPSTQSFTWSSSVVNLGNFVLN